MKKLNFNLPFLISTFLFLYIQNAFPQSDGNTFSYAKLNFNVVINKSTDELDRLWNSQKGFEGSLEMPFYYGNIQAGVRYIPYKEKKYFYHDFSTFFYFAGWGKELNLPLQFKWYNGFKVGAYAMAFHDDSLTIYQKDETELAAGINSRMSLELVKNLFLDVAADYTAVFTHKRIELFLISAGVSYSFKTPYWFKEFLK